MTTVEKENYENQIAEMRAELDKLKNAKVRRERSSRNSLISGSFSASVQALFGAPFGLHVPFVPLTFG